MTTNLHLSKSQTFWDLSFHFSRLLFHNPWFLSNPTFVCFPPSTFSAAKQHKLVSSCVNHIKLWGQRPNQVINVISGVGIVRVNLRNTSVHKETVVVGVEKEKEEDNIWWKWKTKAKDPGEYMQVKKCVRLENKMKKYKWKQPQRTKWRKSKRNITRSDMRK